MIKATFLELVIKSIFPLVLEDLSNVYVMLFLSLFMVGGGAKIGSTPLPRGSNVRGEERCTENEREGESRQTQVESNFNIFLLLFHVLGVGFK